MTDDVCKMVLDSGVKLGLVNVQSMHTTAAVLVNENEPLLHEDFKRHLDEMLPVDHTEYRHDDFSVRTVNMCDDECANGHAHCKALHLPTSVTLNIVDGEVQLGRWQRIFFIELDRSRARQMQVLVLGE